MTHTHASAPKTPKSYGSASVKSLPKSQIEIVATIPAEVWGTYRAKALKNVNGSITIDGFRKGMVPENILIAKVGEMTVLEEMAELAIARAYVDVLIDHALDAIGKPTVSVTKLAADNPLEWKATTAIVPTVTLPDYKVIAAKAASAGVSPDDEVATDKDVDDAILRIRKAHASHEGHDHEHMTTEEHDAAIMNSLPELTDDFVKSLGNFIGIDDFKAKVREMVTEEKRDQAREKRRIRIADAIADATPVEIPEVMTESEVDRIQSQFENDIERMGVKLDDYLLHAKKSIDDLRKEWVPSAEKKAKLQLILNKIASTERISPSQEEVDAEVDHITEHYKDADRERASVYAETILTNEKVFRFLEEPGSASGRASDSQ